MRTVTIRLNEEEHKALSSYSVTIGHKIGEILRTHISIKKLAKDTRLKDFLFDKIEKTKNYSDSITLTKIYITYKHWCKNIYVSNNNKIMTKQQFRSAMEDMDMVYDTGGGGRKIFRFIKMEEDITDDFKEDISYNDEKDWGDLGNSVKTNEDEEWEL